MSTSWVPPQLSPKILESNTASTKRQKANSTLTASRAVPHPSTDRAFRRLTSEFGWDQVYSTKYGRWRQPMVPNGWVAFWVCDEHVVDRSSLSVSKQTAVELWPGLAGVAGMQRLPGSCHHQKKLPKSSPRSTVWRMSLFCDSFRRKFVGGAFDRKIKM
jgi:hypothetical protein